MKKTILVLLMAVMIATPCFAQEVEPEGLFSVDGTLWIWCEVGFASYRPFFSTNWRELGFYKGKVYDCNPPGFDNPNYSYVDSLVFSVAYGIDKYPTTGGAAVDYFLAIMQPAIGLGVCTGLQLGFIIGGCGLHGCVPSMLYFKYTIGIMTKIDDNWIPPEIE